MAKATEPPSESILAKLDAYPFDSDPEFVAGRERVLRGGAPPTDKADFELQVRCFYYNNKFHTNVSLDAYRAYRVARSAYGGPAPLGSDVQQQEDTPRGTGNTEGTTTVHTPVPAALVSDNSGTSADLSATEPSAPAPSLSYAEVAELIMSGRPVPSIKHIPDTVLVGQGSQPKIPKRAKPWEEHRPRHTEEQHFEPPLGWPSQNESGQNAVEADGAAAMASMKSEA